MPLDNDLKGTTRTEITELVHPPGVSVASATTVRKFAAFFLQY